MDEMPRLYSPPLSVKLNLDGGYSINPVTGDSIYPLINSFGDTVQTGIAKPVKGKTVDPEIVARAERLPVNKEDLVPSGHAVQRKELKPKITPVRKENLRTFTPGKDAAVYTIVNSKGDTIPMGVPVPVKGKVVPCLQLRPIKTLPPRMKENLITNLRYLDVYNGMPSDIVIPMAMDAQGNLWIGTMGVGLCKYDGNFLTHFTTRNGLSSDYIRSMMIDSRGNIWCGTMIGGVCMYDGQSFTHYTENEGLGLNDVPSIKEDSHGNIWIGTWGAGVCKFDGQTFTHDALAVAALTN